MNRKELMTSIQEELIFLNNLWHQLHDGRAAITNHPVARHYFKTKEIVGEAFLSEIPGANAQYELCEHRMENRYYRLAVTTCHRTGETFVVADMPRSTQEFYNVTAAHLVSQTKVEKSWWRRLL